MDAINPPSGIDTVAPVPENTPTRGKDRGLYFIAVYTLIKGVLFLVVAVGVFHLVGRDTPSELTKLLHALRLRGDSAMIKGLLVKAKVITDPGKRIISRVLLLYAVLYFAEGTGLLLRKRWAEYFALIVTAIPLPFEIYSLFRPSGHSKIVQLVPPDQTLPGPFNSHAFLLKILVLAVNAGILAYLIYHLRREGNPRTEQSAPAIPARTAA